MAFWRRERGQRKDRDGRRHGGLHTASGTSTPAPATPALGLGGPGTPAATDAFAAPLGHRTDEQALTGGNDPEPSPSGGATAHVRHDGGDDMTDELEPS